MFNHTVIYVVNIPLRTTMVSVFCAPTPDYDKNLTPFSNSASVKSCASNLCRAEVVQTVAAHTTTITTSLIPSHQRHSG